MDTTKTKFSTSVNIKRDWKSNINYIPTPNSKIIFTQILNDALQGMRSFNIIGAYGSGKSSFLMAFQSQLKGEKIYFSEAKKLINQFPEFEYYPIVGEYDSITKVFAEIFGLDSKLNFKSADVIAAIEKTYSNLEKKKKGLIIMVDEFGKFLEYAAKNNPESELYFIQQLAELVNDPSKNYFLINTLHQDFSTYAIELTQNQKHEWSKVKGRLKEITFNEPVEQLLYLASERIKEKFRGKINHPKSFKGIFQLIKDAKVFPLKDYLNETVAHNLLPFDILSASILTLSLQKYGQNERSLFSFLESNDPLGLNEFDAKNEYFDIARIYDYLNHNYFSFINSRQNPHYVQWMAIKNELERIEALELTNYEDSAKIIKVIGLINIFGSASAKIDKDFLVTYCKNVLNIKSSEIIIDELTTFKVIKYVPHNFKYVIFGGTNLDIELEIDKAGNIVEYVTNVSSYLNANLKLPFILAKHISFERGTPRIFQFRLSEKPLNIAPENEIDGFINLIFSHDVKEEDVKKVSNECEEAILYAYYRNTKEIAKLIHEIRKINKVIEINAQDKVAVRELKNILEHQENLLNHYVLGSFYSGAANIVWYYKGNVIEINNSQILNKKLSDICLDVYNKTPFYRNEMVNKTKISSQIISARRNLIEAILFNSTEKDLGFEEDKFPPEKTIYLSLLKNTGLHKKIGNNYVLSEPDDSMKSLWDFCDSFLNSTKGNKTSINDLIDKLSIKPFKLKKGFIDYWLSVYLVIKKDEYALFHESSYLPEITNQILDLILKYPNEYYIKAFDITGIKLELFGRYRALLNQSKDDKFTKKNFIETIKPFIVFYNRDLKDYARKTKRLSKNTIAFREAIAKSTDPEKTFFEDFPVALGFNSTQLKNNPESAKEFIDVLQASLKELRTCLDNLINRFENYLVLDVLGYENNFVSYKEQLKLRYKKLKKHLLLPDQRKFYERIISPLDEREAWLNSLVQVCLGKPLAEINDEEELVLFSKIESLIYELDNLCDLSSKDYKADQEDILKLEVTSFVKGITKNYIRLPKNKTEKADKQKDEVKKILGLDKQVNIITLAQLLEEYLTNE